jgi:predicted O-linked N-acetylglucosamine transferase (SPINDLY family)
VGKRHAQHSRKPPGGPASVPLPLQQAWALYGRGEWRRAEPLCRLLLRSQPRHFGALTLLGVIAAQTRRADEAAALLGQAAGVAAHDATAHNNYGNALRELGRPEQALHSYERALALRCDYADAHYNRALTWYALGRHDEALAGYDRALALKPDYAAAYNNRGVALRGMGRLDEALRDFDRAVALDPQHAGAYNNRGVTLQQIGRLEEALASYGRALALDPNDADALRNQGSALWQSGSFDAAMDSYRRVLRLEPADAQAHNGLGMALQLAGEPAAALESFERAVAADPQYAQAHYHLGNLLRERGQLERALQSYDHALAARPDHAETYNYRGAILHELGRVEESLSSYARALQLSPTTPGLYGIWLGAKMQVCDWSGLGAEISKLEAGEGKGIATPFNVLTLIDSPALQRRTAERWAEHTLPASRPLPPIGRRERSGRIRIGYYSADFYRHATVILAVELFAGHDRSKFETVAFRFGSRPDDDVTHSLRGAFDRFIDMRERSDLDIARLSRELGIDIAVDLKGFTQHSRCGIFAHRAAPLQVNYLGFPCTMGAPYIDYLVADRTLIPEDSRRYYAEKIVYLPDCYQVNGRGRLIAERRWSRAQLGLPPQGFVFCCFNNVYKITPEMFDVWMRVLRRVEGSVLWLLDGGQAAATNLRAAAQARGVAATRLVFAPKMALPEHLARHRAADLFIDTLPCNAHTTASDSLWAGLPVVTQAGESFAARVAASLLITVGLPELVTRTAAEYESLLVSLATDPARLAQIRGRLEHNRLHGPLFDVRRYTRNLESAYEQMYERLHAGLALEHIHVS